MRTELANLTHCAVPFLSRAVVNLCWYYTTTEVYYVLLGTEYVIIMITYVHNCNSRESTLEIGETERQRQRDTERDIDRERRRGRERPRETMTEINKQRHMDRDRETEIERESVR